MQSDTPNSIKLIILTAMKFATEGPRYPSLTNHSPRKRNKIALMMKPIKLAWILFKNESTINMWLSAKLGVNPEVWS